MSLLADLRPSDHSNGSSVLFWLLASFGQAADSPVLSNVVELLDELHALPYRHLNHVILRRFAFLRIC